MFNLLWTLAKTAVILIIAALALIIAAIAGYVIPFILILMVIGVTSFVILHRPDN